MTTTALLDEIKLNTKIDPYAKVWIYQSSRIFTNTEMRQLEASLEDFTNKWQAHGTDLKAFYHIFFNRFICLFVDETGYGASGCSIDGSVHFIQAIEKKFNVSLMNRTDVAYVNTKSNIEVKNLNEFKSDIGSGEVSGDTLVFNNLVATKGEMESNWLVPMRQSWHKRLLS